MVSRRQRIDNVSPFETSSEEYEDDSDFAPPTKQFRVNTTSNTIKQNQNLLKTRMSQSRNENVIYSQTSSKSKCISRNAVIARKNRVKKKMYVQSLEDEVSKLRDENKKLSSIADNQSFLITELRKEVKYMKSVVANSQDIRRLMKNIQHSTGMSVTTSLDKNLTLKNNCVSKQTTPIARKTMHPWDDPCKSEYYNIPTPESNSLIMSPKSELDFESNKSELDFEYKYNEVMKSISSADYDSSVPLSQAFLFDIPGIDSIAATCPSFENCFEEPMHADLQKNVTRNALSEHNYTSHGAFEEEDDVGICLHVSKHRVSLEFCSSCNENASQSWDTAE